MTSKLFRHVLFLFLALCLPFSLSAQETTLPQNYMMEKHGIAEPFYCDLEDPIEEIACMAWDAALGAAYQYKMVEAEQHFQIFFAIELAQIIQKIAQSPRNWLYVKRLKIAPFLNNQDTDICLIQKYGICGNHQDIFHKAMAFSNIKTRHVGFYFLDGDGNKNSHAASEFLINNKWRFIDITWSSIWMSKPNQLSSMLSIDEIRKGLGFRISNELDLWFQTVSKDIDKFAYTHRPLTGMIRGNTGAVVIDLDDERPLEHLPNYVGSNVKHENGTTHIWTSPQSQQNAKIPIKLVVAGVGGCSSNGPILLDDAGNEYPLQQGSNHITVPNGGSFNVKRDQNEICYIVFSDIALLN